MKILFNSKCLEHNKTNHVEGAYRIEPFNNKFEDSGDMLRGERHLKSLYSEQYVKGLKEKFYNEECVAEVNTNKFTYEAACISVDLAVKASKENAFAITRPPGHHASTNQAEGFCFFNNIAIATQKLIEKNKKVCIIDIDGHHGNGTEKIFEQNPSVLYCSLHLENIYPYTGYIENFQSANLPLSPYSGDDILIDTIKLFKILIERFKPDKIAISAGFDGYYKDDLLNLNFTKRGYYEIGKIIYEMGIESFCCLEGGYHNEILSCTKELINGLENRKYSSKESLTESDKTTWDIYTKKKELFKKVHSINQ